MVFFQTIALLGFLIPSKFAHAVEPVNLGTASRFSILTKTGVTNTGVTKVTDGDMGTSPISNTALTGFDLEMDSAEESSHSPSGGILAEGSKAYAADYNHRTPAMMTRAIYDMETAYNDAAGRTDGLVHTEVGAGSINGHSFSPGIYKWTSTVTVTNLLIFNGGEADVWIMQIAGTFALANGARMELTGGAKTENIYWAIAGTCTFVTGSHAEGIFLAKTLIAFQSGSSLNGAALAQTEVTIISATISKRSNYAESIVDRCGLIDTDIYTYAPVTTSPYLRTAGDFVILAKSGVTALSGDEIMGDVGVSPIAATGMTGFDLVADGSTTYSTSSLIKEESRAYAADYGHGTPAKMTQAIHDMESAYVTVAHLVPATETERGGGDLVNQTFFPGIYKWSSTVKFDDTLTFDANGDADSEFIMQIAQTFTVGRGARMELTRGAKAENIYWAIAGVVAFDRDSHGEGIFLAMTNISFERRSSLNGVAFAQTAVTIEMDVKIHKRPIPEPLQEYQPPTRTRMRTRMLGVSDERVELGTAIDFAILAKSAVTNTGVTYVLNGDMGISPAAYSDMTGFALKPASPAAGTSYAESTDIVIDHKVYAANYVSGGTPAKMTTAVGDMETAYNDATGRTNGNVVTMFPNTNPGNLNGETLPPGIYKWTNDAVTVTNQIIFNGAEDDVWIMQIAGTFVLHTESKMMLSGGARSDHIYWAIAGTCTFNAYSHAEGIFLAKTNIAFLEGSSLHGAALAQTAVTMIGATINRSSSNGPAVVASCSPTGPPSDAPTASPVVPATSSPTESPTECPADVTLIAIKGETMYSDSVPPITITEQNGGSVKFEVSHEWAANSIGALYVQHNIGSEANCVEIKDFEFVQEYVLDVTASCMHSAPISIVHVWVVGTDFANQSENAVPPECCQTIDANPPKTVQYTFELNCAVCAGVISGGRRTEAVEVSFLEQGNLRG